MSALKDFHGDVARITPEMIAERLQQIRRVLRPTVKEWSQERAELMCETVKQLIKAEHDRDANARSRTLHLNRANDWRRKYYESQEQLGDLAEQLRKLYTVALRTSQTHADALGSFWAVDVGEALDNAGYEQHTVEVNK